MIVSTSSNVVDTSKYKINHVTASGAITTDNDTGYPGNNTRYYWWVWAYNAAGASSNWSEVSANGFSFTNTAPGLVGAPTLVYPANNALVKGTSVNFQWTAVSDAAYYRIIVSTSSNVLDTSKYKINHVTASGAITTDNDTGYPGNNTRYFWWVWAYNAAGGLTPWSEVSINGRSFYSIPSIGTPTLGSPANGVAVAGASVSFAWSAVADAAYYRIIVSTSSNVVDTTKYKINYVTASGAITTYNDAGYPMNGTKYYWWVWAYDAGGSLSLWSQVSANGRWFTSVGTYIAAPTLGSPANGVAVTGTSVSFAWSAVADAVKYRIIVSTSSNIMETAKYKRDFYTASGAITTDNDTGYPANGTKYYWWVWAYTADGSASLWAEVSPNGRWFTSVSSYIVAPTLVSPANGVAVTGTSVSFAWSAVADAVKYRLIVSTSSNVADTTKYKRDFYTASGAITTYNDAGYPASGTKYYWWVWAYDAAGSPSLWAEVSPNGRWFTNPSTYIAAPTLGSPANGVTVPGASVSFAWSAVADAAYYRIIVSTSSNIMETAKYKRDFNTASGAITNYDDTGYPANGTTYYWWVWAYHADGSSSLWSEVSAKGRSFTSVAV
jgi:hypothetical protein